MDPRRDAAASYHLAAPPPPPTTLDNRAPPPAGHYQYAPPPPPHPPPQSHPHQAHPQQQGYPPPAPVALPPIQQPYGPPGTAPEQRTLPPFHHPHGAHEAHPPQEHYPYNQHNRSGHATPAPVNRTYSHDSTHQRTPTTPAQPGPYPPHSGPDGLQHPPPQAQHHPMDPHAHQGYPPTNGVVHGLPPPHGQQHGPPPPHHEQHTQHMQPVMESHYGQYPPPQQQQPVYAPNYGPISSGQFSGVQRKKQMRATQACEQCRARKQKCDEGNPCSFCKENNLGCQYRDTPPAKTDKNMEKLLSYMDDHTAALRELTDKVDTLDNRIRRVEGYNSHAAENGVDGQIEDVHEKSQPSNRNKPGDHRTAPHKLLLLWPSVQPLLRASNVIMKDSYVMEAEDRGILRLYSRGEGIDEHDGTQPGGPGSPAHSDENMNDNTTRSAPSPPDGLWGTGFPQTPSSDIKRSEPSWGGLKPDNTLDLDQKTISELYESYLKNIHVMHPFLDKQRLKAMFDTFQKRLNHANSKSRPQFVAQMDDDARAPKRQRSNGSTVGPTFGYESGAQRSSPERSSGNAVVYLVLALGKICLYKNPLPGVQHDSKLNANAAIAHQLSGGHGLGSSSPPAANIAIKPSPISPGSTPATAQPTPPADFQANHHSRSRRASLDGSAHGMSGRNLDVIPGLAYYAKAAEILGDQADGNDLVHAQMFLLAGLYKGQLARVKESMSWLTMAGRAVLSLLDRYKLYNDNYWNGTGDVSKKLEQGQKLIKDKRANMIVLASWTCLQLESDILAELPLPSSSIQSVEDMLLLPHKVPEDETYGGLDPEADDGDYDGIIIFYTAQMYLRRKLNEVHRQIYGSDCLDKSGAQVCDTLRGHDSLLGLWRGSLPPALRWNDEDKPAENILAARLRAKYWGALYVVNRPFLDYALHIMPYVKDGMEVRKIAKDVNNNPRHLAEIHLFEAIASMPDEEIWQACKRCIDAAMQSTVALDKVPNRLVVTNIHGTAHAQFGNMLVLAATFYSRHMRKLVDETRFRELLQRTITFLRRLGPISPTSQIDCGILERIQQTLFGPPPDEKHHYANEGVVSEHMSSSATNSFSAST
ncbi:hypothetical protein LTR86_006859 [Recurvomyces mirabilis]|nr:hypothetical protein LTR86_006859 [Recurvomyces mirabilis]